MATVIYTSPLPADRIGIPANWVDWCGRFSPSWLPGVSPVFTGGFAFEPTQDAQLLRPQSGPFAGYLVRLMGPDLSIAGDFGSGTPLPFTGTITGIRVYAGYEDLLIFNDDPNLDGDTSDYVVQRLDGTTWEVPQLLEIGGLSIDVADLRDTTPPIESPSFLLHFALLAGPDAVVGTSAGDSISTGPGDDTLAGLAGSDTLNAGTGTDTVVFDFAVADATVEIRNAWVFITVGGETDEVLGVERFVFTDQVLSGAQLGALASGTILGTPGNERLEGTAGADSIEGLGGNDTLLGLGGDDTLEGGDGADTLNGGDGDDRIIGGATGADLRDVVFAGTGNDSVDGGAGNDSLRGDDGNDTIEGGAGADTVIGGPGDDVLTGSAFSDLIFGNDGFDFINGGFGSDRVNGGDGADRFFHVGVAGHGSDWIQDFSDAEGDRLVWGGGAATRAQFQVNIASTSGAGQTDVEEAFVIYRPTGQILWALVDGAGEASIDLQIGGQVFDLIA